MVIEFVVNWWVVLGVSILAFIMGFLWYGIIFMKSWAKSVGLSPTAKDKAPFRTMFIGFLTMILSIYVLSLLIVNTGSTTIQGGMLIGFLIFLGCSIPTIAGGVLWEKKPISYFWVTIPYELISLLVFGGLLGSWL